MIDHAKFTELALSGKITVAEFPAHWSLNSISSFSNSQHNNWNFARAGRDEPTAYYIAQQIATVIQDLLNDIDNHRDVTITVQPGLLQKILNHD